MIPKQVGIIKPTRDFFFCVPHFMAVVHLFFGRDKLFQFPASVPWELICCLQYASKQGYGCQCLGFLTWTQALMHATAHWGCRNTVRVCTESRLGERSLAVWETWTHISGAPGPSKLHPRDPCHRTVIWVKGFSECYISHAPSTTPTTARHFSRFVLSSYSYQQCHKPPFWCNFPADPVN